MDSLFVFFLLNKNDFIGNKKRLHSKVSNPTTRAAKVTYVMDPDPITRAKNPIIRAAKQCKEKTTNLTTTEKENTTTKLTTTQQKKQKQRTQNLSTI